MLWDISRQRTSAEQWCTSHSAVFWVQPVLIFLYLLSWATQWLLVEPCQGPWLSRRVKPPYALALLQKGWFSSGCIITLMREVTSSLAPLSFCPWLSSSVTVQGQWAVLVEKGRLCEYLGHLCIQSCAGGLCSCLEFFFLKGPMKEGSCKTCPPFPSM